MTLTGGIIGGQQRGLRSFFMDPDELSGLGSLVDNQRSALVPWQLQGTHAGSISQDDLIKYTALMRQTQNVWPPVFTSQRVARRQKPTLSVSADAKRAEMQEHIAKVWTKKGLTVVPIDRAAAQYVINKFYAFMGVRKIPALRWFKSPAQLIKRCKFEDHIPMSYVNHVLGVSTKAVAPWGGAIAAEREASALTTFLNSIVRQVGSTAIEKNTSDIFMGQFEAGTAAQLEYLRDILMIDRPGWELYFELVETLSATAFFEDEAWLSERPSFIGLDDEYRLHCATDAAIKYRDSEFFYIDGIKVPERLIFHPESYKAREIMDEANTEVRRIMIKRYKHGEHKWMIDAGGKVVSEDVTGKLWELQMPRDATRKVVEVLNSTPEPDGSIKTYYLRVPNHVKTAKEAVAWTFGLEAKDYNPRKET